MVPFSEPSDDIIRYFKTTVAVTKDEPKFMPNTEVQQRSDHQICFCRQEPIYEDGVVIIGYKTYDTETCKSVRHSS